LASFLKVASPARADGESKTVNKTTQQIDL
jgi:hypothetical protein